MADCGVGGAWVWGAEGGPAPMGVPAGHCCVVTPPWGRLLRAAPESAGVRARGAPTSLVAHGDTHTVHTRRHVHSHMHSSHTYTHTRSLHTDTRALIHTCTVYTQIHMHSHMHSSHAHVHSSRTDTRAPTHAPTHTQFTHSHSQPPRSDARVHPHAPAHTQPRGRCQTQTHTGNTLIPARGPTPQPLSAQSPPPPAPQPRASSLKAAAIYTA